MLLLNRRYARGCVNRAGNDLFLKLVLDDWDRLNARQGDIVAFVTNDHAGSYRVLQTVRCPGGEAEAWVILRPAGPLPKGHMPAEEARASFAAQFNESPLLHR